MKHRDIFRIPARVEHLVTGWAIVLIFPGAEVSLHYGDEKPELVETTVSLILERMVPDAQS